eukprot:964530-Pleurochrysis_carterae.AAC.1
MLVVDSRRNESLVLPEVLPVVHACASWLAGYASRPTQDGVQVRGRRPAEGAAPSRACVRSPQRGRAKA